MPPPTIRVEETFTQFVRTFRGGDVLSHFVSKNPSSALNADYYFPTDNVIAELKTLETDALNLEIIDRRIMASYKWLGYRLEDYTDFLFGRKYLPDDVNKRVFSAVSRPIIDCVRKANKQIISSRRLIGKADAKGLILIANSGNFGLPPMQLMNVVLKGFDRLSDREKDGIVYFTPNVYHDVGDGLPREIWVPIANERGPELQDFIDSLGKAWFDYRDTTGQSSISRKTNSDLSALFNAKVVQDWAD
ncbi:hypothetical protein [Mesorhizobium sp.]|uniref:hypothetical protein n=1 Tax=Mesorhizobium sp. TaxID=1871066 RepID=UPI000FE61FF5|nr:hypothetical protein [Mesorhizobium sp.]RWC59494.1 MAG: hypothetical protein EOS29_21950 [Mesorhizobium sp.]RWC60475.1 MAG: hypothetical protein EOS56_14390 [Mesorhizobium sp.]